MVTGVVTLKILGETSSTFQDGVYHFYASNDQIR